MDEDLIFGLGLFGLLFGAVLALGNLLRPLPPAGRLGSYVLLATGMTGFNFAIATIEAGKELYFFSLLHVPFVFAIGPSLSVIWSRILRRQRTRARVMASFAPALLVAGLFTPYYWMDGVGKDALLELSSHLLDLGFLQRSVSTSLETRLFYYAKAIQILTPLCFLWLGFYIARIILPVGHLLRSSPGGATVLLKTLFGFLTAMFLLTLLSALNAIAQVRSLGVILSVYLSLSILSCYLLEKRRPGFLRAIQETLGRN